jgi:hypothetical protein
MKTDHFCVNALSTNHTIWSFRVREDVQQKEPIKPPRIPYTPKVEENDGEEE